jgi:para-aminobenzoate synthetase component I
VIEREIAYADPVTLLAAVADDPASALLHAPADGAHGRRSYLALEPYRVLRAEGGRVTVGGRPVAGDAWEALRRELGTGRDLAGAGRGGFRGGAVGYLGYELGGLLEPCPAPPPDDLALPDMLMLMCDVVVALDHAARRAVIHSSGLPEPPGPARRERAAARAEAVAARLAGAAPPPPPAAPASPPAVDPGIGRAEYADAVRRVVGYILAGDAFQVNLSRRLRTRLPEGMGALDLFRRLQAVSPAPFGAWLRAGDLALASSSPERFLAVRGGRVETRPIKGTRPRGATAAEDAALAGALRASDKDRAENVMIVDLLRNDLSRVCRDGSIAVPVLCGLERFATVWHLVSTVTGELRPGQDALDLLRACFPGGSISGAPKLRAREIIAELEPVPRGPYCGALGWIGWDGDMDTSIVIRTLAVRGRDVVAGVGGGVTAGSSPAAEYDETVVKARGLLAALSP